MTPTSSLTLTQELHALIQNHLLPGDGLEAAAVLLCSRTPGPRLRLLAVDAILVPHEACKSRKPDHLTWPGTALEEAIDRAEQHGLSIILMHSHPNGLFGFSSMDDASDKVVMPSLQAAIAQLHGSAVMVGTGAIRARVYDTNFKRLDIEQVTVPGVDIARWWADRSPASMPVAFTQGMREELARLSAMVIGASGTGSIVAEQLARLGFGRVVLVDHDVIEHKNLNRILNSTLEDANSGTAKVHMLAKAIERFRGPGVALACNLGIAEREAVLAASQCDVIFSCTDRLDARYYADKIAACFMTPLFDIGVSIPTRKATRAVHIAEVCTRLDYVRPGGPTLGDRGVYTPESLREEELRYSNQEAYEVQIRDGYIKGMAEQAPDVISLNMKAAADCVLEYLARCYRFRHDGNAAHARSICLLAACEVDTDSEQAFRVESNSLLGRGDREPLLGLPNFRHTREPTV